MSSQLPEDQLESIAVIGLSGAYPGADDLEAFWRNLCDGVESIVFFGEDHQRPPWVDPDASYVGAKGVMESAEWFDPAFFGYSPEEARMLDPQHRMFLERGWEALEDAGYDSARYDGPIGVFAGVSANTYLLTNVFNNSTAARAMLTDKDFVATRLAYKMNLRGPAVVVQAACSTSLLAVCLACQSLLNYQCDMAIAGGATVWAPTDSGYQFYPGGPMSTDGHCRAFDAGASGFVPGSGAGAVVLKRLSEAIEDRDTISAVIKGFAVNNDGSGKVGYTAPSVEGQAEVIVAAQQLAEVDPETITYVEAHGTGTELGDPIEVAALTQAFRTATDKRQFCALGSVKPNIGHLDAAAGIAGLTKAVLAVREGQLPPSINYETPNPKIDFANSPFVVNDQLRPWQPEGMPRRAGVSAFGIGGTNAHVVLEEAPAPAPADPEESWNLLPLSATTEAALDQAASRLADFLQRTPTASLSDAAHTLQIGRCEFARRRFVVCSSREEAVAALRGESAVYSAESGAARGETPRVAFLFPGQAAQYPNMARGLYTRYPVFRDCVDQCSETLQEELGFDLRTVIFPGQDDETAAERLAETDVAQPAIFMIEYALSQLWMSFGLEPVACLGHSIGEYVAACIAGVFELDDALRIVAARGRLMSRMEPGGMLAVQLSESDVQPWLDNELSLAAVNGPALCVISGSNDRLSELESKLKEQRITSIRLKTSHAFHSASMDPMLDEFAAVVAAVRRHAPAIPFLSNLTGDWIGKSEAADPAYWRRHLRGAVRFADGLRRLCEDDSLVLLEVGPGRTLASLAQSNPDCGSSRAIVASTRHPRDTDDDVAMWARAAGRLWLAGVPLGWSAMHAPHERRRISLPTYPFQRQRYWACDEPAGEPLFAAMRSSARGPDERYYAPVWKRSPALRARPVETSEDDSEAGHWLVFADQVGLASRLVERLEASGTKCIVVRRGEQFQALDSLQFVVDPMSRDSYQELFKHLDEAGVSIGHVIHCWGVAQEDLSRDDALREGRVGFYSLLYLAQVLVASRRIAEALPLSVLVDNLHDVCGDERIIAEKALLLGPCRVLPQEHPQLLPRVIDLAARDALQPTPDFLASLQQELVARSDVPVLALRGGHRWEHDYELVPLAAPSDEHERARLKPQHVCLITGGLGGIGQALGKYLAETFRTKLALTARTPLPPRDEWPSLLAEETDDPAGDVTLRRIRGVMDLESLGAEVRVFPVDVTDADKMKRVVAEIQEAWGPVSGVIHAAGVAGGGVAQLKTAEVAERVFAPKVAGTRALQDALQGQPLDYLVLCSSISAIAGGVGQIDYCAANAFLDAVAWEARSARGAETIAVNWNAWNEVGMAVETDLPEQLRELKAQVGLADSLTNAEGVDAFRRILADGTQPQVAITLNDLPRMLRTQFAVDVASLAEAAVATSHAKPELDVPYVESRNETERALAGIWEAVFGFGPIGVHDDYFEMGGHSLMALQLMDRVRVELGVELVLSELFDNRTIEAMAQRVDAARWARDQVSADDDVESDRETTTL